MPQTLEHVTDGDVITDGHWNKLVDQVNCLMSIRGDGTVNVTHSAGSVLLAANLPPAPRRFLVVQDTPDSQGYVTAHWLRWDDDSSTYTTDQDAGDQKIYDLAAGLASGSYSGPNADDPDDPSSLPFYGSSGPRITSRWSKQGFCGAAKWDGSRGVWLIDAIEHVARWINVSYSNSDPNASYSFGNVDGGLTVLQSWDGLDPTKTPFTPAGGGEAKTSQIALVNSPDDGFTLKSGDKGTAVWRDDLDNSAMWQYQIVDGGRCQNT